jgi:SWI/SNF-related matrix-associated actin-dependent regulator of chromatin subfamily B protein 1
MREQIQAYLKSLTLIGYAFDGSLITDADLALDFLPPLSEVVRNDEHVISTYTPFLTQVTETDHAAFERDRDRDKDRKKKRGTRGRRLVALPDREPVKTNRSRISGGMDEHGVPIALAAIPKQPLPSKPTPSRPKTAPRRAAAIAAKANITTMSTELQQGDHSAAPSPEHNVVMAPRASKRIRIMTTSPEPSKPAPIPAAIPSSLVKQEVEDTVHRTTPRFAEPTAPEVPITKKISTWACAQCHRPEDVLDDKRRFDGPIGRSTLCSDCGEYGPSASTALGLDSKLLIAPVYLNEKPKSKEATPPPFRDVASPDSTLSEDGAPPTSSILPPVTPSPIVGKPSSLQSPRGPATPSRPGMALQRVTSAGVSIPRTKFPSHRFISL